MGNLCSRPEDRYTPDTAAGGDVLCKPGQAVDTKSNVISAVVADGVKQADVLSKKAAEQIPAAAEQVIKAAEKGAVAATEKNAAAVETVATAVHALDDKAKAAAEKLVEAHPEGAVEVKDVPDELIGNLLDPENGPAKGLAYQVHYLGPPRPPCEEERLQTTCAINRIDGQEDPEIANILRVIAGIFKAPVSLCALFDKKRVFISDSEGGVVPRGDFPWRWTLCGWSLAFTSPMILVIPDTHKDARFADNVKVVKEPNVRCYVGAPLIASNGHRLGTLCFVDTQPRVLDAASCMIMNNFSELVVRQLEKDIALKAKSQDNADLAATYGHMQRTIDAFEHCVVLLDTQAEEGWKIVFTNQVFTKITGVDRDAALKWTLPDLFEGLDGCALPNPSFVQAAADGKSFELAGARIRANVNGTPKTFVLRFRPAGKESLDECAMPIGIPSFLPVSGGMLPSQRFYFMTVDAASSIRSGAASSITGSSVSSVISMISSIGSRPEALDGLEMGHLLGKGSFGSVYYGTYFGTPVAVKIIETDVRNVLASSTGASLEAILSTKLRHPLIVSTLKYTVKQLNKGAGSDIISAKDSMFSTQSDSKNAGAKVPAIAEEGENTGSANAGAWGVMTFDQQDPGMTPNQEGMNAQMPSFENGGGGGGSANTWGGSSSTLSTNSSGTVSGGPQNNQTWMIMEYCDKGSLQDAIDRGWLRFSRSCVSGAANMQAVIATALELASALNFLHSQEVVHGDLSGWNCMLSSSGSTAGAGGRGFVCKIADFGLSRSLDIQSKIQTRNYGTMTHMPPETLVNGVISKSTDVYSFGVLMWQMYTGSRPWSGLSHAQIIMQVGTQGAKLVWPQDAPPAYRTLATQCMDSKTESRPVFEKVVAALESMQRGGIEVGDM